MTRPAGQGESCGPGRPSETGPAYCSACGRPVDGTIRRGSEAFCTAEHADEFERDVATMRQSTEVRP